MRKQAILAILASLLLLVLTGTGAAQNQKPQAKGTNSSTQVQKQQKRTSQHTIRDANRDGVCDVCKEPVGNGRKNAQGNKADKGKHWGPGDGSGLKDNRPKDGTGYGSSSGKRMGSQDGTGIGRGYQRQPGSQPSMGGSKGQGKRRGRN